MTRSEAITALYALFNAPHNADINLVGLNVLLDELYKSHPQEEPWPEETEGHIAGGVHPPQRTERPVDCERCNRLEEQAYDLVGKLRVANIKLSMRLPRTWVELTDDEIWEAYMKAPLTLDCSTDELYALARTVEAKLKKKNTKTQK